jgi:hypothetical protein
MAFPYANLQVSVGLSGGLQTGDAQDATQTVKKLNPEEKVGITSIGGRARESEGERGRARESEGERGRARESEGERGRAREGRG